MGVRMEPIRDLDRVHDITVTLSKLTDPRGRRMFLMWMAGINLGLRISDLLELRVGDLRQSAYTFLPKKQAHKKAARKITIPIPPALRKAVRIRCEGMDDSEWLLQSMRHTPGGNRQAISRQQAHNDIHEIARICGITQRVGCHTMRKTFGYHYYQKTKDVALLQEWFYHSSPATTLIYIGVSLDNFKEMVKDSPFADMDDVAL